MSAHTLKQTPRARVWLAHCACSARAVCTCTGHLVRPLQAPTRVLCCRCAHSLILDRGQVRWQTRQLSVLCCNREPAHVSQSADFRIELAAFPLLVPKLAARPICTCTCLHAFQTLPPFTSGALLPGVLGGLCLDVLGLRVGNRGTQCRRRNRGTRRRRRYRIKMHFCRAFRQLSATFPSRGWLPFLIAIFPILGRHGRNKYSGMCKNCGSTGKYGVSEQ